MRFIFKTDYNQDVKLAKHGGHVFWYSLLGLLLVAAPWVVAEYWLAQLTFVLIYAVVGLGLMLLAGFTGLFSLGHAAFLGVGAYTQAVMVNAGVPFPLALVCAGVFSAIAGVIVGLPALRVKGIYLGMATLAFGFIVEEGMARWESVTGGNAGLMVTYPKLGSWTLDSTEEFYFLCLLVTVGATLAIVNDWESKLSAEMDRPVGATSAPLDAVNQRVPAKRLGEAWEIAEAVLFLAAPSSAYITGQVLVVDGGLIG